MRIALLVPSFERGGAETQCVTLALALARRGEDVTVLAGTRDGPLAAPLDAAGVPVIDLGRESGRAAVLLRLIRALRALRPDVLQAYLTTANIAATLARPFVPGLRVVWGVRASDMRLDHYGTAARLAGWLERRLAGRADLIVANAAAGRDHHVALGFPSMRLVVVPNGIDTERFRPHPAGRAAVRAELGLADSARVIGQVARLDPMKDHPTALAAMEILAARDPDVRLVCVGAGDRDTLRRDAETRGLGDRVLWLGARDDVPRLLAAFDIHSSSSAFGEGFSNALAEAMAAGVPTVATDVGDAAAIVGELGEIVPPGDPAALADAWERLLKRRAQEGTALSAACRARIVERFGIDAMASQTLAHYCTLTGAADVAPAAAA